MMNAPPPYLSLYPSNSFSGLLGEIHKGLTSLGAPPELAGTQLVAFASLLTQGVADVVCPNGLKTPVGANCLVIASSAYRNSWVFDILITPIKRYLVERSKGNFVCKGFDFFLGNATSKAIAQSLRGWPVAGLFTNEAGQLNRLLKDTPTLVRLINNSTLRNVRDSTGYVQLTGHRLSFLLLEQPAIFRASPLLQDANDGGDGLINRFFIVRANGSNATNSFHPAGLPVSVKHAYEKKIHELIECTIQHVHLRTARRPVLCLSSEATQYLISINNEIRRNNAPGSPWFFVSKYIQCHIERVLRLAGVLHVFEYGANGDISVDTIQCATLLAQWHIEAFAQMAYEPPKLSRTEADAIELEFAIRRICHKSGHMIFLQSEMRAAALDLGLTPARFTHAVATLCMWRKIQISMQQNVPWIELNAYNFFRYR